MGGDAALGDVVHVLGANLDFHALLFRADHRSVNAAIAVGLGRGDEILEPLRHHLPTGMDHAQRAVAVRQRTDDDAEAENIRQLLEGKLLGLQFAPDRKGPLAPAIDPGLHAMLGQFALDLVGDAPHPVAAHHVQPRKMGDDGIARLGIEFGESQILQLLAHILHADAPCQRGIDVHRLLGDAPALVDFVDIAKSAHIV